MLLSQMTPDPRAEARGLFGNAAVSIETILVCRRLQAPSFRAVLHVRIRLRACIVFPACDYLDPGRRFPQWSSSSHVTIPPRPTVCDLGDSTRAFAFPLFVDPTPFLCALK